MTSLEIEMNMSNVMGETMFFCDGFNSNGRLSLQSSGDKVKASSEIFI